MVFLNQDEREVIQYNFLTDVIRFDNIITLV